MASKKDFAGVNTSRVYGAIEQATSRKGQQGTASPQEQLERSNALRTQGRKGCRATRINMAFTHDNHEFIKVVSRGVGMTMTEFTNFVISRYRAEHPETYEQMQAWIKNLSVEGE